MDQERDFSKKPLSKSEPSIVRKLFVYVRQYPWLLFSTFILLIFSDLANTFYPLILKTGIDRDIANKDIAGLYRTATLLGIIMLGAFVLSTAFQIIAGYLGQKVIYLLRRDVLHKLTRLTNRYFDKTPTGRNLTYLTNDIEAIKQFISTGIVSIFGDLLKILFILSFMLAINWRLTLFALTLSVPLFIIGTHFFRLSIRKGYRGVRHANSVMNTLLVETLTGIKEINLFNHRNKSIHDFNKANANYLHSFLKIVHSYSIYFPLIEVVTSCSMLGILFFAHYALGIYVTLGELFAFFIYINLFFRPLFHLAEQVNAFQSAVAACERVFGFMDTPIEFTSTAPYRPQLSLRGDIAFENVTFSYDPGQPVLNNLSFNIQAGEKIAIVGSTGAGKTTIISLLNRLYKLNSGRITLDGRALEAYSLAQLRENIATIPQDIFLFTGSFYDNIALYKKSSLAEVKTAAERALIAPVIAQYPKGYEQSVLEEGKSLSTGQKQLLAFARAFVKASPIVILDEATANIDSESEKLIEQALDELLVNKTAIIIAHRLATIARADKILVLHHGKLMDFGTHAELIQSSAIYKKLHSLQEIQMAV